MVKRIVGYIIALLGILGFLVTTFSNLKDYVPAIKQLTDISIMIASVVLLVIGIILIKKTERKTKGEEVPIFKGKKIVGYRRH